MKRSSALGGIIVKSCFSLWLCFQLTPGSIVAQQPDWESARFVDIYFTGIPTDEFGKDIKQYNCAFMLPNGENRNIPIAGDELLGVAAELERAYEVYTFAQASGGIVPEEQVSQLLEKYLNASRILGEVVRRNHVATLSRTDLEKSLEKANSAIKEVASVLSKSQLEQLEEFMLKQNLMRIGISRTLIDHRNKELLGISDKEEKKILERRKELNERFRQDVAKLREKYHAKVLDKLTDQQRKEWNELHGDLPAFEDKQLNLYLEILLKL